MTPDDLARRGSKLRKVLDLLLDGRWHAGAALHETYSNGRRGWCFDSALAQLRKKGLVILSRPIRGQDQREYLLLVVDQPTTFRVVEKPYERTPIRVPKKNRELNMVVSSYQPKREAPKEGLFE